MHRHVDLSNLCATSTDKTTALCSGLVNQTALPVHVPSSIYCWNHCLLWQCSEPDASTCIKNHTNQEKFCGAFTVLAAIRCFISEFRTVLCWHLKENLACAIWSMTRRRDWCILIREGMHLIPPHLWGCKPKLPTFAFRVIRCTVCVSD